MKRIWSINFSTQVKSDWPEYFCYWLVSERKESGEKVIPKISQEMVGTTRSRVSFHELVQEARVHQI